ncbi:hypothetical protein [Pararhizobium sp.]|uniref:hypothetical protein n=1 Tax=Pararhizobium sp. TaxID=1977563 RepID=UPI002722A131|nr:hypothetical protein [Pararhizobium sp.]MDO9417972.1 hypothetical protein [Pararhizobium sp.]
MSEIKQLKDQRIPIMMTADELALIDDWSFTHRIRSRGEAIRRLCQTALRIETELDTLGTLIQGALDWQEASERWERNERASTEMPKARKENESETAPAHIQAQLFTKISMIAVKTLVEDLVDRRDKLAAGKTVEEAILDAAEQSKDVTDSTEFLNQFMKLWDEKTGGKPFRPKLE